MRDLDTRPRVRYHDDMTCCPNPESHRLDAEDRFFEGTSKPEVLTLDQDEAIQILADADEAACEGVH